MRERSTRKGLVEYLIGFLTFAIIIWVVTILMTSAPVQDILPSFRHSDAREIRISAYMWDFYPSEVNVNAGDRFSVVVTSLDTRHGIAVYGPTGELLVQGDLIPGEEFRFELEIHGTGGLHFHCNRYCGIGHDEMHGHILVGS